MKTLQVALALLFISTLTPLVSVAANDHPPKDRANHSQLHPQKDGQRNNWNKSEYSGRHSAKDISMAMYSKGFAWLSGSPADNEKLSIGKNAQFFGFVAIRYQSERVAKRGDLGRAFYELATPEQRTIILNAVKSEEPHLDAWWANRSKILRQLEQHLYSGDPIDEQTLLPLAHKFGSLNADVALYEARAFAEVEDLLSEEQWKTLRTLRKNPGLASMRKKQNRRLKPDGLTDKQAAQYEDLFAKAFTWLTGTMDDNQIIPLGQPAQFFGFVSIRHKSGHAASRGKISNQFKELLSPKQRKLISMATQELLPIVTAFRAHRLQLLLEMDKLRKNPSTFNLENYNSIAKTLGLLEIKAAITEAQTYKRIRSSMTKDQIQRMMDIRSEYILDSNSIEAIDLNKRGTVLYNLCLSCHASSQIAPNLKGIFNKPIAHLKSYNYSDGLKEAARKYTTWNEEHLNEFLTNPKQFAPGTKMGFQGLLNPTDRKALIEYLKKL